MAALKTIVVALWMSVLALFGFASPTSQQAAPTETVVSAQLSACVGQVAAADCAYTYDMQTYHGKCIPLDSSTSTQTICGLPQAEIAGSSTAAEVTSSLGGAMYQVAACTGKQAFDTCAYTHAGRQESGRCIETDQGNLLCALAQKASSTPVAVTPPAPAADLKACQGQPVGQACSVTRDGKQQSGICISVGAGLTACGLPQATSTVMSQ